MENSQNPESKLIGWASNALNRMELTWDDLSNKTVLDVGSGENKLAQAATIIGSSAKVFSVDGTRRENWIGLPTEVKTHAVEAVAEALPFADDTFDLIVNIASVDAASIQDEVRVLKPGGEIRLVPIASQILDMWNVAYYLQVYEGMSAELISETLERFESEIEENDGWRPNEYAELEKQAITTLTQEEKVDVIDALVARFSEVAQLPLDYQVTNPSAPEPNGYIVYKKPSK